MVDRTFSGLHVLAVADVGRPDYHMGDEAMAAVAARELAARGVARVTFVNTPPTLPTVAGEGAAGGMRVLAPDIFDPRVGAAFDPVRDGQLAALEAGAATEEQTARYVRAVAEADAVLVCGGGNLCASWPDLLYLRVATARLAATRGVPVVLTGQTLGPALTPRQAELLGELMTTARFVGVRDEASLHLARQLAPAASVALQRDEAVTLAAQPLANGLPAEYVAFAAHPFAAVDHSLTHTLAEWVRDLHDISGLPIVWLPNTGTLAGPHEPDSDAALAAAVQGRVSADVLYVAPVLPAEQVVTAIRGAQAMVSTRFHPVVMALAGAIPTVAVSADRYTATKLDGALRHAGMHGWRLPLTAVGSPAATALFAELWARRSEVAAHLATVTAEWPAAHHAHWAQVWSCLTDVGGAATNRLPVDPCAAAPMLPPTTVDTASLLAVSDALDHRLDATASAALDAAHHAHSLEATLAATREEAERAVRRAADLHHEVDRLHAVVADLSSRTTPPTG